jgi:hypothetical protein
MNLHGHRPAVDAIERPGRNASEHPQDSLLGRAEHVLICALPTGTYRKRVLLPDTFGCIGLPQIVRFVGPVKGAPSKARSDCSRWGGDW